MTSEPSPRAAGPNQLKLLLILAGGAALALAAGYWFLLRTDYAVLFSDMRQADAAAVVAELDRRGVSHRLRDGGTTILVPSGDVDSARLAIAGSEVTARGAVGFELFNESDMGLTDFAQRINYQRALQGEIARTIAMMDGIDSARVHLALPERALFRGNRSTPKAAVTVTPTRGRAVDASRVAGIQRLVAAAVPDLALADVVVLDEVGRVVSAAEALDSALSPELEEHEAVRRYYRARARAALDNVLTRADLEVRVAVLPLGGEAGPDWRPQAGTDGAAGAAGARNFRLRVAVSSATELESGEAELARNALTGALDLDELNGDSLVFSLAPAAVASPAPAAEATAPAPWERPKDVAPGWSPIWAAVAAGLIALLLVPALRRRRGADDWSEMREALVARIRGHLGPEGGKGG